jgi:1-phosphatidylinositol-4-phosphate 5-kinase
MLFIIYFTLFNMLFLLLHRNIFKVSEWDFKKQMGCHAGNFSRVGTPGKSGAFFFITKSTSYLLKSVTEEELITALEIIPSYHRHVQKNPYTLLSNFYLLFEVSLRQNKYRFIVMNNVFFTPLTIHRKYDLKGSTAGRVATESERKKKSPILKDKDILQGDINLNLSLKQSFYRRLESDVTFLQENDIMDYSLLLGVHNHEQRTEEENKIISRFRIPQADDSSFSGRQKNYCSSFDGKEIYFFVSYLTVVVV